MCRSEGTQVWTYAALSRSLSRRQISRRTDAGSLVRVRRGVYATREACDEVVAAAAHGGTLGCESAARHHGLWVLDEGAGLHVWMHDDRHQHPHPDCSCTTHWDGGSSASAFSLPSIPKVLLQIFRCRGAESFFVALESARRLGLIDARDLRTLRSVIGAAGRDLIDFSRDDSDSGLESLVRLRTRRHGWTIRTQTWIVATGRVDLLIEDWLIVETDGRDNHDSPTHRHKDLVRDANAAAWGHVTLRFDYAMVVHDWDLVERAIVATLALRPSPRRG